MAMDPDARKPTSGINLLAVFPAAFTMVCSLLFILPLYTVISVANEPVVKYFSAQVSWVLLIIPVIIAVTHIIHVRTKVPNKYAVMATLIVPGFLLLIFANAEYVSAADKADKLFSTDCDTFSIKRELQREWEAAYSIYTQCLNSTAASSAYSIAQLQQNFRIQDCEEYPAALKSHKRAWNYLQYLEENNHCSGWCYHGQQIWSSQVTKDGCAITVSSVYKLYVRPNAGEVCLIMIFTLAVSAVLLILIGPVIRSLGIDW